ALAGENRIEALGEGGVLGGDAGGVAAFVPVVVAAGGGAELPVLRLPARVVVAERDQRRGADGDGVGAERQGLGHVGAAADAARDDQLHLAVHVELLQGAHGGADRRQGGDAAVLDEHLLGRGRAAL